MTGICVLEWQAWAKSPDSACAGSEMLWLSQRQSLSVCQAKALGTQGCVGDPSSAVIYENGDVKNCCEPTIVIVGSVA